MGKLNIGILGGFSGKVGPVVGADWNSIPTVRAYQPDVRNPQTAEQTAQRQKFTIVIAFIRVMLAILRVGFKNFTNGISPYAKAISIALKTGVKLVGELWQIDYENFTVSQGCLLQVDVGSTLQCDGGAVSINWQPNSGTGNALATDVAYMVLYNITKNEMLFVNALTRNDGYNEWAVISAWDGDTVHVYDFLVSADGKIVADSNYAGSIVTVYDA